MTFFIDNCISRHFAEALRAFKVDVIHLQDEFPEDTIDRVWIPEACKKKWIIITCDQAQTKYKGKTAVECALLQKHRGRAFFLPAVFPTWPKWKQLAVFFRCWEQIVVEAQSMKPGQLLDVSDTGKVTRKNIRKVN